MKHLITIINNNQLHHLKIHIRSRVYPYHFDVIITNELDLTEDDANISFSENIQHPIDEAVQ